MILLKGPPLSRNATLRLAKYVFSFDWYACVTLKENGEVVVRSEKVREVEKALKRAPLADIYKNKNIKREEWDVQVVGTTQPSINTQ